MLIYGLKKITKIIVVRVSEPKCRLSHLFPLNWPMTYPVKNTSPRLLSHRSVIDPSFTRCGKFDTQEGARDGDGGWYLALVQQSGSHPPDGDFNRL